MSAFAQCCCGKDTKWQAGSLKVYGSLTKCLMKRALSDLVAAGGNAITAAGKGQTPRHKVAARRFWRARLFLPSPKNRWEPRIGRCDSTRRFAPSRWRIMKNLATALEWIWTRGTVFDATPWKRKSPRTKRGLLEKDRRLGRVPLHYKMKSVLLRSIVPSSRTEKSIPALPFRSP